MGRMLCPLQPTRRWAEAHTVSSYHYPAGVHRADFRQELGAGVGAPSCSPCRVQLEVTPQASPGLLRKQVVVPQEKAVSTAIPVPSHLPTGFSFGSEDPGLCITSTEAGAGLRGTKTTTIWACSH